MQINQLSSTCVTITLTAQDLEDYGVTYESLDYLCPHTRKVIQSLLCEALAQTDFSPGEGQLLIEATPLGDDGCLLTFTALEAEIASFTPRDPAGFFFSSFEMLCKACHCVYRQYSQRLLKSSLYQHNGAYILFLKASDGPHGAAEDLLAQYGEPLSDCLLYAAIEEHDRCILYDHAIEILDEHFGHRPRPISE